MILDLKWFDQCLRALRTQDLKLNFLFVVLFAPVVPWAIIPTLLARVMEVRLKITSPDCRWRAFKRWLRSMLITFQKPLIAWFHAFWITSVDETLWNFLTAFVRIKLHKETISSSPSQLPKRCSPNSQYSRNLYSNLVTNSCVLSCTHAFPTGFALISCSVWWFCTSHKAVVTSFTVFWYLGLSLVTFNNQLHTWKLSELLLTWLGCGLAGSIMVSCLSDRGWLQRSWVTHDNTS